MDSELPCSGHRPIARYHNGNTEFLHGDALGSSVYITEQPGWVSQKLLFYPWGQRWASWGLRDERFASLGERDAETGNDPTPFRMYQPRLYRWLSPDPVAGDVLNPQSLNRYAYVLNNPTNLIDPLGLDSCNIFNVSWEGSGNPFPCNITIGPGGQPYNTNPSDQCAYVGFSSAECRQPPGLWPNGDLIFPGWPGSGAAGGGGGSSGGGSTANSGTPPALPWTVSVNVDFNFQIGPLFFTFAKALAIDSKGCIAYTSTSGLGGGAGESATLGASVSGSNGQTVQDLGGPFANASASVVEGTGPEAGAFWGSSPNGPVRGGTVGWAVGQGERISGGGAMTQTSVTTLGHVPGGRCGKR